MEALAPPVNPMRAARRRHHRHLNTPLTACQNRDRVSATLSEGNPPRQPGGIKRRAIVEDYFSSTNVTFMLTRYSTVFSFSTLVF